MKTEEKSIGWICSFDNGGALTVFAADSLAACKIAEEKAQEHGWNLRVKQAIPTNFRKHQWPQNYKPN